MHSNVPTLPGSLKVKKLIDQLKSHKITPLDVPNKYATLPVIAKVERELGILKTEKRGFDVLKSHFFVDEVILSSVEIGSIDQYSSHYFSDFTSFYNYLDGDIYNNACYFQYNFSADEIQNFSIDLTRINTTSFIHEKLKTFLSQLVQIFHHVRPNKSKSLTQAELPVRPCLQNSSSVKHMTNSKLHYLNLMRPNFRVFLLTTLIPCVSFLIALFLQIPKKPLIS